MNKKMTVSLGLLVVLLSIGGYFLPKGLSYWVSVQEPQWREQVENRLGDQVRISPLVFEVSGVHIRLKVDELSLGEGSTVRGIEGQVDWIRSLWTQELRVSKVATQDMTLQLHETSEGWKVGSVLFPSDSEASDVFSIAARFELGVNALSISWKGLKGKKGSLQLKQLEGRGGWSQREGFHLKRFSARELQLEQPELWSQIRRVPLVKGTFESNPSKKVLRSEVEAFWDDASHASILFEKIDKQWQLKVKDLSGDLSNLKGWIPDQRLSMGARVWLKDALKKGIIDQGEIALESNGDYEVRVAIRKGEVLFHEKWPGLNFDAAKVEIFKNALNVESQGLEYLGADIQSLRASIEDLSQSRELEIALHLRGIASELEAGLSNSPLKKISEILNENKVKEGVLKSECVAKIPLQQEKDGVEVQGSIEIPQLTPKGVPYKVQDLKAEFRYTDVESAFQVEEARVLGGVWKGDLNIQSGKTTGLFEGEIQISDWGKVHQVEGLEGKAKSAVRVHTENEQVTWTLSAKSKNLKAKLPEPLLFDNPVEFQVEVHSDLSGKTFGKAEFLKQKFSWEQERSSWSVIGNLKEVSFEGWRDFLKNRTELDSKENMEEFSLSADLAVGKVFNVPYVKELNGVKILWNGSLDTFDSNIQSNEMRGTFKRLSPYEWDIVADTFEISDSDSSEGESSGLPLEEWPFGKIQVGELKYSGKSYRSFKLLSAWDALKAEYRVSELEFDRGDFKLKLEPSRVSKSKESEQVVSELAGVLDLKGFEYTFQEVKALEKVLIDSGRIRFQVMNPSVPWKLNFKEMRGIVSLAASSGKLMGIRNFATRAINFLSFSRQDTLTKQIQFSKMTFFTRLKNSVWIVDSLRALFGSVYLRIAGTILLDDFTLDLKARVTPKISDLLDFQYDPPIPTESAAVEILKEQRDPSNWLTHQYRIEGTLMNPDVGLKVF